MCCVEKCFPQFSHFIPPPHNWFAGWRLFQSIIACVSGGIGKTCMLSPIVKTAFRPAILINFASIVFFISFPFGCGWDIKIPSPESYTNSSIPWSDVPDTPPKWTCRRFLPIVSISWRFRSLYIPKRPLRIHDCRFRRWRRRFYLLRRPCSIG